MQIKVQINLIHLKNIPELESDMSNNTDLSLRNMNAV